MDRTSADAFVFAKASGLFSKFFIGARARRLFQAKRLRDIWALLFEGEPPLVPEGMLALLIERKSSERAFSQFRLLLSRYDRPDPVSLALLRNYDYNNLKALGAALQRGDKEAPFTVDIGEWSALRIDRWPDIGAITRDGPLSWYNRVPGAEESLDWEVRLDHEYYQNLWSAVVSLGNRDRLSVEPLVREEITLQNIVWAMRLRSYYGKTKADILPLLFTEDLALSKPALGICELPLDVWDRWASWKYSWLLNPHSEGVPWALDPRWAQLAAEQYLYRVALRSFRQQPFTAGVLVSFFKIQQLELQMIRVATEGIRLGMSEGEMAEFMGSGGNV